MEIWKDVVGYEGLYQVSNLGRVKNILKDRFLSQSVNTKKFGYYRLVLKNSEGEKHFLVHRLVATAFLGNPPKGYHTNHKNGNTFDNRMENLEWVTAKENSRHRVKVLKNGIGEDCGAAKLKENDVRTIRKILKNNPKTTQTSLARRFNVSPRAIRFIKNNETWTYI